MDGWNGLGYVGGGYRERERERGSDGSGSGNKSTHLMVCPPDLTWSVCAASYSALA